MESNNLEAEHAASIIEPVNGLDEYFRQCIAYRSSDEYLEAIRFIGRFTKYAPLNAYLIYAQRPTATFVATASRWSKRFGRRVMRSARVYDVEDTTGKRLPAYFHEPFKVKGHLYPGGLWGQVRLSDIRSFTVQFNFPVLKAHPISMI